jgi:hypothetical protein
MNDISILDLFWLILKFLAALGLVGLLALGIYLVWVSVKRGANIALDIVRGGHNASVTAIVCFSLVVVALVTGVILAVGYLNEHPNFLH